MRILFVAPASQLSTQAELLRAAQDQTPTFCDGAVDRQKLESYLARQQYDAIHFAGHGDLSILDLSDGQIEVQDLLTMLSKQHKLRLIVITACLSARVGTEIHNALHIPVVMMQAEIADQAAVRFSETLYRALRSDSDLAHAVEVGRATVAKLWPTYGDVITLVNGDMATDDQLSECMRYVKGELSEMRGQLTTIEAVVNDLRGQQPRLIIAGVGLLILLLLAQIATPFLNAALAR